MRASYTTWRWIAVAGALLTLIAIAATSGALMQHAITVSTRTAADNTPRRAFISTIAASHQAMLSTWRDRELPPSTRLEIALQHLTQLEASSADLLRLWHDSPSPPPEALLQLRQHLYALDLCTDAWRQERATQGDVTEELALIDTAIENSLNSCAPNILALQQQLVAGFTEAHQTSADALARTFHSMLWIASAGFLLMAGCLILLDYALRRPIALLGRAARQIRAGNLELALPVDTSATDALSHLMRDFNFMTRRLASMNARMEADADSLRLEKAQLSDLAQHKTRFIRHLGHELRSPLASIVNFAELLLEGYHGDLTPKQEETLRRIITNANHMLDLLNDLVDQAKLQAGTLTLQLSPTPLAPLVADVIASFEPQAAKQQLKLILQHLPDPDPTPFVESRRLRQVLVNLITNALKFTPPGGSISLSAEVKGQNLLIDVADTGIGIAAADYERIFEEFQQLDTQMQSKGAGLGLQLARQLCRLHGGDLTVHSTLHQGSVFTITLPIQPFGQ